MRKNVFVYNNCSKMAEMLYPFCAGEGICVQRLVNKEKAELASYLSEAHLMLLDIFMDEANWMTGVKLVREIRAQSTVPIIIAADQKAEVMKILALNAGADDFISTKTNPLEILARIKALIRRYTQMTDADSSIDRVYRLDELEVDDIRQKVTVNNREVRLTSTEYKILQFLISGKGKVYSGDEIYKAVWGMQPIGADNVIPVHIRHIREKIEEDPKKPHYLKVAWGRGYMVG